MTTYAIKFTDQNPRRTLILNEGNFYGQVAPHSQTQDPDAISTSKVDINSFGHNAPGSFFGTRIQENILRVLENFAGVREPAFPVPGQLWYDRRTSAGTLRVFDPKRFKITNSVLVQSTQTYKKFQITVQTNDVDFFTRTLTVTGNSLPIINTDPPYDPVTNPSVFEKTVVMSSIESVDAVAGGVNIRGIITDLSITTLTGWKVGGWQQIHHGNTFRGFNAANSSITGAATGALTLSYSDAATFDLSLTGNVTSVTVSGVPGSFDGISRNLTVMFTQAAGGNHTVTWGTRFKFPGGTVTMPTLTNGAKTVYSFISADGGNTWCLTSCALNVR